MPVTCGFNHVATLTADMERLVGFYSAAFGAEVRLRDGGRAATVPTWSSWRWAVGPR